MKKVLIMMMCVIMVVCFMPTVAMAETGSHDTGYDGKSLPQGPDMSGTVVNVTAANAQYTLDGAYGSIDGKTINFTESINTVLHIGRPTKYKWSNTEYFVGGYSGDQSEKFDTAAALCNYKAQTGYTKYCYYSRTMSNVTFTSEENVTLEGFDMTNATGHVYEGNYDFVRDKQLTNGTNDGYYGKINITGLTFDGLTINHTGAAENPYAIEFYITSVNNSTNILSNITFKNCNITGTASGIAHFMNNGGKLDTYNNITFEKCNMSVSSQEENKYGVLVLGTGNLTVKNCSLEGMTRAVQTQSGGGNLNNQNEYGKLVITDNKFDNIKTYLIKVAKTNDITGLTVTGNSSTNSAANCQVRIEDSAYAGTGEVVIQENNWDNNVTYKYEWNKDKIAVAEVNNVIYSSLEDAINAATGDQVVTLLNNVTLNATLNITKNVTINLKGHNITCNGDRAIHVKSGRLTLDGTGVISSNNEINNVDFSDSSSVIRVGDNNGTADTPADLNIGEGVTISSPYCYGVTVFGSKTKEAIVVDGKIRVTGSAGALSGNGSTGYGGTNITINPTAEITAANDAAIYHPQSGDLTINGGKIVGTSAIECKAGETKVVVSGNPTITATGVVDDSASNNNGTSSRGYAVAVVENAAYAGGAKVTIESGTYTGAVGIRKDNEVAEEKKGSIAISGGTFSTDVSAYVANGYFEYAMRNGTYIVQGAEKPAFTTGNYWSDLVGNVYTEMYSAPYIPPTPTTPTGNVTNSGSTAADNATTSADLSGSTSTSNGTTTATVDKTTADKIVDKAVENKSTEVVIDATANTTTAADSTTTAQVTIPTETLGAIAKKTEADVTIKTDVAEVKLDNAAAAAVAEQAEGDTVQIIAEKVKEDAAEVHFELKVVCSDGKVISDFKGGNVAVTVALPKAMADKKVVCVYIDDNGHMSKVAGQKNADGTYTFNTGHFSSYAIMAEEEADAAIAAQKEAIKNIKIKLTSKQVKTKAGKKAVKITWTAAAGDKVLDGVEVYRSTERYKGYGTEPFYTSTKGGNTGSYTNTKSLKKGTKYYYRVRGYVLVDGQKVYTDYSTKAWRTVK